MQRMNHRGQSTLELCIMLAVVIIALVGLQTYIKYAAAGRLKSSADSISQTLFNPHKSDTSLVISRVSTDVTTGSATRDGSGAGKTVSTTAGTDETSAQDKTTRTDVLLP